MEVSLCPPSNKIDKGEVMSVKRHPHKRTIPPTKRKMLREYGIAWWLKTARHKLRQIVAIT